MWDLAPTYVNYFSGCRALGMEDKNISDSQISASSDFRTIHLAHHARLNNADFWAPERSDVNPWLQIDLQKKQTVTKIATQGRSLQNGDFNQWVTEFSLNYSQDMSSFHSYKQFGVVKVSYQPNKMLIFCFVLSIILCHLITE